MKLIHKTVFFDDTYITVYWCERGYVYVDWRGYVSSNQVKQGCEKLLECCIQNNCDAFINDNRNVRGSWNQSLQWLETDFIPRLVENKVSKIAFIYSTEQSARYSVNRLLELTDQYDGQTFETFEDASEWLLGYKVTDNKDILNLKYKGEFYRIKYDDILYISRMDRKVLIQTQNQQYSFRKSLQQIMDLLPQSHFFRIHRSYIVNINKIDKVKYHAGGYYRLYIKDLGLAYLTVSKLHIQKLRTLI